MKPSGSDVLTKIFIEKKHSREMNILQVFSPAETFFAIIINIMEAILIVLCVHIASKIYIYLIYSCFFFRSFREPFILLQIF
jgi:hypothetical protein